MKRQGLVAAGLAATLIAVGCGGSGSSSNDDNGNGNGGGLKLNIQNGVSSAGDFMAPFDATPDPDGKFVYFTALTKDGDPAVFKATAAKGGAVTKLASGPPLASPVSIAISEDGKTLFIADTAADNAAGDDDYGAVFALSTDGGPPSAVAGTEGTGPRAVEVADGQLWVTGTKAGVPGLRKMPVGGGALSDVAVGAPFADPSGVTISSKGVAYVADTGATSAALIKVENGTATVVTTNVPVGFPAGVALTKEETTVMISGFDPATGHDTVFAIDVGNPADTSNRFDDVINQFTESAGLHRAKGSNTFAWADSQAGGTGTVYVLTK